MDGRILVLTKEREVREAVPTVRRVDEPETGRDPGLPRLARPPAVWEGFRAWWDEAYLLPDGPAEATPLPPRDIIAERRGEDEELEGKEEKDKRGRLAEGGAAPVRDRGLRPPAEHRLEVGAG